MNCYVIDVTKHIIIAFERTDESVLAEYRKLHQHPGVDLRSLAELHYHPDIKRIFMARDAKLMSAGKCGQDKRTEL